MKKCILIALAALAFSAAASAQPYALVAAGMARLKVDCAGVASCDKSDTAFKFVAGWNLVPAWAFELGYFDYGKARATEPGLALEIDNTAVGLGLAYHQELTHGFNAVARLGVARVRTRIGGSLPGLGAASESDRHTQPYGGLGLGYQLTPALSVDAAWDYGKSRFSRLGLSESGQIHAFSLGLRLGF